MAAFYHDSLDITDPEAGSIAPSDDREIADDSRLAYKVFIGQRSCYPTQRSRVCGVNFLFR